MLTLIILSCIMSAFLIGRYSARALEACQSPDMRRHTARMSRISRDHERRMLQQRNANARVAAMFPTYR